MQNKDNCEFCYHPRPASGCGWVVVGIVGLFVSICIIASVYHEINFHPGPVNPVADTLQEKDAPVIDDSTFEDHSRISDAFSLGKEKPKYPAAAILIMTKEKEAKK